MLDRVPGPRPYLGWNGHRPASTYGSGIESTSYQPNRRVRIQDSGTAVGPELDVATGAQMWLGQDPVQRTGEVAPQAVEIGKLEVIRQGSDPSQAARVAYAAEHFRNDVEDQAGCSASDVVH